MVIQFRLLMTGVKLEKQRFDERVGICLQELNVTLENELNFADSLGYLLLSGNQSADSSVILEKNSLEAKLNRVLVEKLINKGIRADFTFAITNRYATKTWMKSAGFVEKSFHFDYYNIQLKNRVLARAGEERVLHLDVSNVYKILLGELKFLVIPSISFLIILLICLWFLVKMLRKEERLNAVKNEFINNLTHELKTPVFSISLAINILKQHLETGNLDKARQFLAMIGQENERLKTHIEKVLELATLDSPNYQLEKQSTDLNELVKEVIEGFKIKIEDRNGTLKMALSQRPLMANLDKTHFKNVIHNLLENALKYSLEKVEIMVVSKHFEGSNQLIISDKGVGIPIEHQKKIFDKFYRVPTENLHEVKGFGLGLNYVKKIVESHGGEIYVESDAKNGTSFFIKIPTI